jgi:hypothetical protein
MSRDSEVTLRSGNYPVMNILNDSGSLILQLRRRVVLAASLVSPHYPYRKKSVPELHHPQQRKQTRSRSRDRFLHDPLGNETSFRFRNWLRFFPADCFLPDNFSNCVLELLFLSDFI